MTLEERLGEMEHLACRMTDGAIDEKWYTAFKWMQDATSEIVRLREEVESLTAEARDLHD